LRRLLNVVENRLANIAWSKKLLLVVHQILLPLTARLLGQLAELIFQEAGRNALILDAADRLITLWFIYALVSALLKINLAPLRARFWSQKVLLPMLIFIGVLHLFGLLQVILNWGFSLGQENLKITVGSLLVATATVIIFIALSRGMSQILRRTLLTRTSAEPALTQAVSALVSYAVVIAGVWIALSSLGLDLTTLAVIVGGLSVGLGFGLQEIVNNFISGFILLFDRSLGPGDVVQVGDNVGVVQTVGIRSVTIKTRDNVELIVPNSHFLTEVVTNMTRSEQRVRIRIGVGVTYQADPREVEAALLEAAQDHPDVLTDPPPRVQFLEFGDSSLNFSLLVWTDQAVAIPFLASDLRYKIWDALATRDIEIPFPQRDIHIRSGVPWSDLTRSERNPADET
jgi:small-conductance mechanosensitive channel